MERCIEILSVIHDDKHQMTPVIYDRLAKLYLHNGQTYEAKSLFEKALNVRLKTFVLSLKTELIIN